MQLKPRFFIGKHRELRRPVNIVDESLMQRIEDARHRLRLEGKDVKPLRETLYDDQRTATISRREFDLRRNH